MKLYAAVVWDEKGLLGKSPLTEDKEVAEVSLKEAAVLLDAFVKLGREVTSQVIELDYEPNK